MTFSVGHIPAHKGKVTTTEPIRDLDTITRLRDHLKGSLRDTALFSVALNSALRASDLVKLQWSDTTDDGRCITLRVLERKTGKVRLVPLNEQASEDLRKWSIVSTSSFIYAGQRGPYTIGSWSRLVKDWCAAVGLTEHIASHTLRKSFVRLQHDHLGTSLTTLMVMLRHSSPVQTLTYMGRMSDDVAKAYSKAL